MAKLTTILWATVVLSVALISSADARKGKPRNRQDAGGLGPVQKPTRQVKKIVRSLSMELHTAICEVDSKCLLKRSKFIPIAFRQQVVAGTVYFVSLKHGAKYYHARIYSNLQNENNLEGVLRKNKDDKITYFEPVTPKPSPDSGSQSGSNSGSASASGSSSKSGSGSGSDED